MLDTTANVALSFLFILHIMCMRTKDVGGILQATTSLKNIYIFFLNKILCMQSYNNLVEFRFCVHDKNVGIFSTVKTTALPEVRRTNDMSHIIL